MEFAFPGCASRKARGSRLAKHERDYSFAYNLSLDLAYALRLPNFPPSFCQLYLDHEHITGTHRLAPFNVLRRHKICQLPGILNSPEHQQTGNLSDGFELQHSWHQWITWKMSLKIG